MTFCKEMENQPITRMLRWFQKDPSDNFVGEAELKNVSLTTLQTLFKLESDNPMYDCFPVDEVSREFVENHTGIQIRLSMFDYFVEADADTPEQQKEAEQVGAGDAEEAV